MVRRPVPFFPPGANERAARIIMQTMAKMAVTPMASFIFRVMDASFLGRLVWIFGMDIGKTVYENTGFTTPMSRIIPLSSASRGWREIYSGSETGQNFSSGIVNLARTEQYRRRAAYSISRQCSWNKRLCLTSGQKYRFFNYHHIEIMI